MIVPLLPEKLRVLLKRNAAIHFSVTRRLLRHRPENPQRIAQGDYHDCLQASHSVDASVDVTDARSQNSDRAQTGAPTMVNPCQLI